MAGSTSKTPDHAEQTKVTREILIAGLNEDLAREYQAIIAYVVYSQVLDGAEYMNIASELEVHAGQELKHALAISKQLDYFNATPTVQPKPVKVPTSNKEMLHADLNNENETIRNYRLRVIQSDKLGEYATAELIRSILVDEQDHQMALATALGIDVPEVGITEA